MTISERLAQAQQQSVALYLQRQDVEAQRQRVSMQAQAIDAELLKLDGEIRVLQSLKAEADGGE